MTGPGKNHWQVFGPTLRELHLLFDEHQAQQGDDGTNDLFVSELIRLNEKQAWFVTEHLTNMKTE